MPATIRFRFRLLVLTAFCAGLSGEAQAHHSYAMFDRTQYRVLVGTVKAYENVNPHGYLDLLVETKSGHIQAWSVESPSVGVMARVKITSTTFKPGDKVSVTVHPLRNGTTGGDFVSAILPDGSTVGPVEHSN